MNCIHNSSGGSLRELLSRNVGQYAAASFLVVTLDMCLEGTFHG